MRVTALAILILAFSSAGAEEFVSFDDAGNLEIMTPVELVIPRPEGSETVGPEHFSDMFGLEKMQVSQAGYVRNDAAFVVEVQKTNAAPGTLSNEFLPVVKIAGRDFRARSFCTEISEEELPLLNDTPLKLLATTGFSPVPAISVRQIFATSEDGTIAAIVSFGVRMDDCGQSSREAEFNERFEAFVARVQEANGG